MIEKQVELEKRMTENSIQRYRNDLEKAKQTRQFGSTPVATRLISRILDDYKQAIEDYLDAYWRGKPIKSTFAAITISRLDDVEAVAYITAKTILTAMWSRLPTIAMYRAIGQAIEDEFKMREFKKENSHYYESIQKDLNSRGAKTQRKKNITMGVFNHRLNFHLDRWTVTEKFQTGLVLTRLFIQSTGLVEFHDYYQKNKHYKQIIPTQELVDWLEATNEKLELLQPLFLPMVAQPKEWTSVLEGGYLSPYIKRNKLIKNNDRNYLKELETTSMPIVYEAINHLQNTKWQINTKILEVVQVLWEEGKAIAELPDREDEPLIPYPYPDKTKDDSHTEEEIEIIKKWKRDTYEIHKRNVAKRSNRLLVSQILRIANQFKTYETIYFPYQMDFRGRLYPIPVLLQPQGTDLAKGLLRFAEGKPVDSKAIKWLEIHGANVYGYDKESYNKRIKFIREHKSEIVLYAQDPLANRGWVEADKPFQFLAFCYEYSTYLNNPDTFVSHLPIQLDGTCNGLQHYSALLRDSVGGKAVNLVNAEKPSDIYQVVANRLKEKLDAITNSISIRSDNISNISSPSKLDYDLALKWLELGINRKLTKRPVMVLPYGGTILSCREYIGEYLTDTYSPNFLWQHFGIGQTPTDCVFRASTWLSKYLWQSIQETLKSATVGMAYLRKVASIASKTKNYLEWQTPVGLIVRQAYPQRKKKDIRTELYGRLLKCTVNLDQEKPDIQRQLNGICPNFIHSLDAACLMLYILKAKEAGIDAFMTVHDSYGVHACDTETSAKLLREAFVEIYHKPILEDFTKALIGDEEIEKPEIGTLDIEEVKKSEYFFN